MRGQDNVVYFCGVFLSLNVLDGMRGDNIEYCICKFGCGTTGICGTKTTGSDGTGTTCSDGTRTTVTDGTSGRYFLAVFASVFASAFAFFLLAQLHVTV